MNLYEQIVELRVKEAVEENYRLVVRNLLKESDFSVKKIASLLELPVDFIRKVKKDLR